MPHAEVPTPPAIAVTDGSHDDATTLTALAHAGLTATAPGAATPMNTRPGMSKGPSKLRIPRLNLRKGSGRNAAPQDPQTEPLGYICVRVIAARNLEAKDRNGKSDPYLHLRVGDARSESETIKACLNPAWGQLEGVTEHSYKHDGHSDKEAVVVGPVWKEAFARTRIEVIGWDKDRFHKDEYLGEISLGLDDWVNTHVSELPVAYESPANAVSIHRLSMHVPLTRASLHSPSGDTSPPRGARQKSRASCS